MTTDSSSRKRKFEELTTDSQNNELEAMLPHKRRRKMFNAECKDQSKISDDTNLTQQHMNLITNSIVNCMSRDSELTQMTADVIDSARRYYLSIIRGRKLSAKEKKKKIYEDLVVGALSDLKNIEYNESQLSLKYCIGLNDDEIKCIEGRVICVGRERTDIQIMDNKNNISRIHCFILLINDKLIVYDGWSSNGTFTKEIDDGNKKKMLNSTVKNRNILKFDMKDRVHLKLGSKKGFGVDIIINPKYCIVCTERARVISLKCGHKVLCNQCFKGLQPSQCPICRKVFDKKLLDGHCQNNVFLTYNGSN